MRHGAGSDPAQSAGGAGAFDRRGFLGSALAALAAVALPEALSGATPQDAGVAPAAPARLERIGLQLYTVRADAAKDLEGTLARVAAIGYDDVEFAGYQGHSAKDVRRMLTAHRLMAPSAHVPLQRLRTELPQVLEEAHVVGHRYVVCPYVDEKERTADGFADVAASLNRAGEEARSRGVALAYHNHDFEFKPLPDGRKPYDLLLHLLEPELVDMEMDLFWAVKGGADPLAYFKAFPGRFTMLHVKDMDAAGKMTEVGKGTINFRKIFAARLRSGMLNAFVEHDDPVDAWASITDSYNYLKKLSFGTSS